MKKKSPSSFDSFLAEEKLLDQASAGAKKRVLAVQLHKAMKAQRITKVTLAKRMRTSQMQVDKDNLRD